MIGVDEATARALLHRARARIRHHLAAHLATAATADTADTADTAATVADTVAADRTPTAEVVWTEGSQTDSYDRDDRVDLAIDAADRHFRDQLRA